LPARVRPVDIALAVGLVVVPSASGTL